MWYVYCIRKGKTKNISPFRSNNVLQNGERWHSGPFDNGLMEVITNSPWEWKRIKWSHDLKNNNSNSNSNNNIIDMKIKCAIPPVNVCMCESIRVGVFYSCSLNPYVLNQRERVSRVSEKVIEWVHVNGFHICMVWNLFFMFICCWYLCVEMYVISPRPGNSNWRFLLQLSLLQHFTSKNGLARFSSHTRGFDAGNSCFSSTHLFCPDFISLCVCFFWVKNQFEIDRGYECRVLFRFAIGVLMLYF